MDNTTETRTFVGDAATFINDGYAGFRIGQRYRGTPQADGTMLVSAILTLPGSGVTLKVVEWEKWFEK